MEAEHALYATRLGNTFEMLRISASIFDEKQRWSVIHFEPNVSSFEVEHAVKLARDQYNEQCMARADRERAPIIGRHAGMCDLFVPIVVRGRPTAQLISGPFATSRPTSTEIMEQWRRITGRQGSPADPEFSNYLATTLSTLVLSEAHTKLFGRFGACFARLLAGEGDARALLAEAEPLRDELEKNRSVDRIWEAARSMVDPDTSHAWSSPHRVQGLINMGLRRVPDLAVAGLLVSRGKNSDLVEEILRRYAFQRACVELGLSTGDMISGQIGDHGVTFLATRKGSAKSRGGFLMDIAERAHSLARRFDLRLHIGLSAPDRGIGISEQYRTALTAAERALSRGERVAQTAITGPTRGLGLGELREELAALLDGQPARVPAKFERYLEAVAYGSEYGLEVARVHLRVALERMLLALRGRERIEERSLGELLDMVARAEREAQTVSDLFGAYRSAVSDLCAAVERPLPASRDRSLRRAREYVEQHYTEPLRLETVAKVAGFAPNYFSQLFKKLERLTFEQYVHKLRIQRARQLLSSTTLEVQRIAQLAGFSSATYFCRSFRQAEGCSPARFRSRFKIYRKL